MGAKKKTNNPWAICTSSVGRNDKKKYERCVKSVKKESTSTNILDKISEIIFENFNRGTIGGKLKNAPGRPLGIKWKRKQPEGYGSASPFRPRSMSGDPRSPNINVDLDAVAGRPKPSFGSKFTYKPSMSSTSPKPPQQRALVPVGNVTDNTPQQGSGSDPKPPKPKKSKWRAEGRDKRDWSWARRPGYDRTIWDRLRGYQTQGSSFWNPGESSRLKDKDFRQTINFEKDPKTKELKRIAPRPETDEELVARLGARGARHAQRMGAAGYRVGQEKPQHTGALRRGFDSVARPGKMNAYDAERWNYWKNRLASKEDQSGRSGSEEPKRLTYGQEDQKQITGGRDNDQRSNQKRLSYNDPKRITGGEDKASSREVDRPRGGGPSDDQRKSTVKQSRVNFAKSVADRMVKSKSPGERKSLKRKLAKLLHPDTYRDLPPEQREKLMNMFKTYISK